MYGTRVRVTHNSGTGVCGWHGCVPVCVGVCQCVWVCADVRARVGMCWCERVSGCAGVLRSRLEIITRKSHSSVYSKIVQLTVFVEHCSH
jgi:hypothetical protein